jgi:competence protein ComEA
MSEPDDGPVDLIDRPLPAPSWRELLDLERVLGGRRVVPTIVVGVGMVAALAVAVWFVLRPPALPPVESTLPMAGTAGAIGATDTTVPAPVAAVTEPTEIVVHAAGAVGVPGIHRLPAGSRVADLLAAAGGPAPDADLDLVNLAAALTDGAQVRFPRVGEQVAAPIGGTVEAGGDGASSGPVDLNTASATELEALPGVGPTIAAAIVEHRERNGPFRSVDDLLDVPGIGPAKLDQLRGAATV